MSALQRDLVLIIEHLEAVPTDLVQALLTSLRAAYMDQQTHEYRVIVVVSGALSLEDAAKVVCNQDDQVDAYNREVIHELRQLMQQRSEVVEPALHFFSASRQIERMADHATNIAEDVVYLVDGEITRHQDFTKEPHNG